jgi:hypothetical protein
MNDTITIDTLQALLSANSVSEVIIMRAGDAYSVKAKFGMNDKILRSQRERVRLFKSLETCAKVLRKAGAVQITLDLS